ncbi:MAG: HDOD domain-containing protein [Gammaproteobacteria bacterium]|nr:HDOD domain-containing protein [Gammaproteobacteria bacterium]
MSFPPVLKRFLEDKGVKYDFIKHSDKKTAFEAALDLGLEPNRVARATLLRDHDGILMVIYPVSRKLNLEELNNKLNRKYTILNARGVYVPLAAVYHVDAIVDETLLGQESVHLVFDSETLCSVSGSDFQILQGTAVWYDSIFYSKSEAGSTDSLIMKKVQPIVDVEEVHSRREQIKEKLHDITELPAIPQIALQVLQLGGNPYANASDLAAIIEQDPSLSTQLLRYAKSPFYGFRGEIDSISDAISRVLGFDMVMDMAMGISMGKAFKNPADGPLGLNAFWRHATYSAALVQKLGCAVTNTHKPRPGMAYLAGLMHNMGILLLGHLFKKEFNILTKTLKENPGAELIELEQQVLGVTHMEMGAWLMEAWNLPDELIIAVKEHHNAEYNEAHSVYPNLILLSNRLLTAMEMGDEIRDDIPAELLEKLGLTSEQVVEIFDVIIENKEGLDYMALQMAA